MTIWVLQITDSMSWLLELRFRSRVETWVEIHSDQEGSWKSCEGFSKACLPASRSDVCTSDVLLFSGFRHGLLRLCRKQCPYSQHGLGPGWGSAPRIPFLRLHSKLLGTGWLKTEIDSLTAPEARSSKSRYGQGWALSRCSRTEPPPASCGYRHCLACGCLTPPWSLWSHCFLLSQNPLCLSPLRQYCM